MLLDIKFPTIFKQYQTVEKLKIADAIVTESTNEPSALKVYLIDSSSNTKQEVIVNDKEIFNIKDIDVVNFGVFNCKHRLHVFTFKSQSVLYLLRLLKR